MKYKDLKMYFEQTYYINLGEYSTCYKNCLLLINGT